ncbi:MAG: hypothetical protein IPI24_13590 [Ignavibacteria bacterium]|nr:hypothetical protein [Ignavibacteria bacterium]
MTKDGCISGLSNIISVSFTGLDVDDDQHTLVLYPNPVRTVLMFSTPLTNISIVNTDRSDRVARRGVRQLHPHRRALPRDISPSIGECDADRCCEGVTVRRALCAAPGTKGAGRDLDDLPHHHCWHLRNRSSKAAGPS